MNIIEKLKENLATFEMMSKLMRQKAEAIGIFDLRDRYQLDADYTEEPEIVRCEIFESCGGLDYIKGQKQQRIHFAMSNPDFIGFEYEDGQVSTLPRLYKSKGSTNLYAFYSSVDADNFEVLTPTHALFRRA
jgi:hypothetical protein